MNEVIEVFHYFRRQQIIIITISFTITILIVIILIITIIIIIIVIVTLSHFVPNLSFGAPVLQSLTKALRSNNNNTNNTKNNEDKENNDNNNNNNSGDYFFDVHLMVEDPITYIDSFKRAGADMITFHIEATRKTSIHSFIDLFTFISIFAYTFIVY